MGKARNTNPKLPLKDTPELLSRDAVHAHSDNYDDITISEESQKEDLKKQEAAFDKLKKIIPKGMSLPKVNIKSLMGYDKKEVERMLDFSVTSYNPKEKVVKEFGFPTIDALKGEYEILPVGNKNTDVQLYIFKKKDSNEATFAFRGTVTSKNVKSDINIKKTALSFQSKDGKGTDLPGKTHRGFKEAYDSMRDEIHYLLENTPLKDCKINITGHSLGGALANLCALDLHQSKYGIEKVVTFGAPRVFDEEGAKQYYNSELSDKTLRVVQEGDPVPKIPFGKFGFRHVGTGVKLEKLKEFDRHKGKGYKKELEATDLEQISIEKSLHFYEPPKLLFKNLKISKVLKNVEENIKRANTIPKEARPKAQVKIARKRGYFNR